MRVSTLSLYKIVIQLSFSAGQSCAVMGSVISLETMIPAPDGDDIKTAEDIRQLRHLIFSNMVSIQQIWIVR